MAYYEKKTARDGSLDKTTILRYEYTKECALKVTKRFTMVKVQNE